MSTVVVTEPVPHGHVILKTSIGDISIELFAREAPKAVRNFVQLCLEGYYDGVIFHRVVPNFIAQTGDPTGTGKGGDCIYDEGTFEDEFNQRLKFSRRGLVAMANQGTRNSNLSQFFFTLDRTDELQNRNTIFGRVAAGDTLFNVLKLNDIELEPGTERPTYPPTIKSVDVVVNPFEDIVPRITAAERKEQNKAKKEMKLERAKQKELAKRKGTKNAALLSFGNEPEEPVDPSLAKTKFKSSHDALDDPRLKKQVIDDRGTSATLPPGMENGPAWNQGPQKRKASPEVGPPTKAQTEADQKLSEKLQAARAAKAKKVEQSASDKVKADIAKVQADLRRMAGGGHDSDDSDDPTSRKAKKPKRSGPSLLQLEREKYAAKAVRGKQARKEEPDVTDVLEGFRNKLLEAKESEVAEKEPEEGDALPPPVKLSYGLYSDDEIGEESDDEDWMSHKLVFRKDATLDRHSIDEYSTHDPLAKNALSLDEMKAKADASKRSYSQRDEQHAPRRGGDDRDRRGGRDGGGGSSGRSYRDQKITQAYSGAGRDRRDGRGGGGGGPSRGGSGRDDRSSNQWGDDRPQVRGSSWKQDRVTDLA